MKQDNIFVFQLNLCLSVWCVCVNLSVSSVYLCVCPLYVKRVHLGVVHLYEVCLCYYAHVRCVCVILCAH